MTIGFDGSRTFASWQTGTENYSYQLLAHLLKIDKKNQYIVYVRKNTKHWTAVQDNVIFREIRLPRLWTQVGLSAQTFKDKLDVLFIPAHTLPIIRRPNLKTVVTVHDLGSEYLPAMHQLKQRLYLKWITKYQLKTATKLIAVSDATKDDLIKKVGIGPEKVEVVCEGVDRKLFKQVKSDLLVNSLKHYNLEPGNYYLFVGTVQPRKNLERLIKAFACLHPAHLRGVQVQLVIVGSKGWLSNEIYELPKKLGIEDKVKFLGFVPKEDLPV